MGEFSLTGHPLHPPAARAVSPDIDAIVRRATENIHVIITQAIREATGVKGGEERHRKTEAEVDADHARFRQALKDAGYDPDEED